MPPGEPLGLAVSGGSDSLGLLKLAVDRGDRPLSVATVDHGLRDGSADDARHVAALCADLGVPHARLSPARAIPRRNVQAEARIARYSALADWVAEQGLCAVATGHQMDDQAETLAMRFARGSGVHGLAGVRGRIVIASPNALSLTVVRPCLDLRRSELMDVVIAAGWRAVDDPANSDVRHDRTRVRRRLSPKAVPGLMRSARALAEASDALRWAEGQAAALAFDERDGTVIVHPGTLPTAIQRALLQRAIHRLRPDAAPARGPEMDRLLAALSSGGQATLRGLLFAAGAAWTVQPAPDARSRDCKPTSAPYLSHTTPAPDPDA